MQNISLRMRIFLSYFALIFLAALLINWFSDRQIVLVADETFYSGFDEKVNVVVGTVEDILVEQFEAGMYDEQATYEEVTEVAGRLNVSVTLIDVSGEDVLFDTELGYGDFPVGEWEDLALLTEDEAPTDIEYEVLERVYRSEYVFYGEDEVVIVRVGESWDAIQQMVLNRRLMLSGATGTIGMILLVIFGSWLSNTLTRPLKQLRASAQQMATGDLKTRSDTNAPREVAMLAQDFNEMADAVESMVAEQKAFASNAAHELRTPLTAIRIRTETLLEDDLDHELAMRYIQEIDQEAKQISRLVDDLRLLARSDANNLVVGDEQIDVGHLLQAIQKELTSQLVAKNLSYRAILPSDLVLIEANTVHLRVVFRNLIENAIKYTPEDGTIEVVVCSKQEQVEIHISDNGMGIADEDLPLVFHRFFRADRSHNRTIMGSGLGLSLVQSIVHLYKGTITIQSDGLGKGTIAHVILPVSASR